MVVWKGLLKKEWILMRLNIIVSFTVMIIAPLGIYSVSRYFGEPEIFVSLMIGFVLAHVFYLPFLFLDGLNKENNGQIWLHNPNGMGKMIAAKFLPSFLLFFISLLVTSTITFIVSEKLNLGGILLTTGKLPYIFLMGVVFLTIGGILLTLWVLLLWTIYHALANFKWLKKIRWLIIFVILIGTQIFSNWFQTTVVYEYIQKLWLLQLNIPYFKTESTSHGFSFQFGPVGAEGANGVIEFPVIYLLLQLIVALFMFLFSVWLLERKVEV